MAVDKSKIMSQFFSHNLHSPNKKEVNFQARVDVAEKYIFNKGWIPTWNPIQTDLPRLSLKKTRLGNGEIRKHISAKRAKELAESIKGLEFHQSLSWPALPNTLEIDRASTLMESGSLFFKNIFMKSFFPNFNRKSFAAERN